MHTYKPVVGASRRRQYSEDSLDQAIKAVKNGMSIRTAAASFSVPRSTLRDQLKGRHPRRSGGQCVLSPDEERIISQNIATMADWGYPVKPFDVRILVKDYLKRKNRIVSVFNDGMPGDDWCRGFLHRNRSILRQRLCQNISPKRAELSTDTMDAYFENLQQELSDVPPSNIINFDETNLTDDPRSVKCIFRRGVKYPERIMNSTKSSTSIMFACTADGKMLNPYARM